MRERVRVALQLLLVISLLNTAVIATTGTTRATTSPDGDWQELNSEHFVIKYKQGYESSAETVLSHLKVVRKKAAKFFPDTYDADHRLPIYVYPQSKWDRGPGHLYWTTRNGVQVNLLAPEDSPRGEAFHRHGLAHEYANIVMYDYTGDENEGHSYRYHNWAPAWFGEGISEYFAIQIALEPSQRDEYVNDRNSKELRKRIRDGKGYFTSMAQDKYEGGYLIAKYMFATYEKDAIFSILTSKEDYFYDAVSEELGITGPRFREGWLKWAETNIGGSYSDARSAERSQEVSGLKEKLSKKNATVNMLQTRLSKKNRTIESLQAKFAKQKNRTDHLRNRIERKNQTIKSRFGTLAQKNSTKDKFIILLGLVAGILSVLLVAQRRQ